MARLDEKAVIGNRDYEYVVDHIMEEPNNGLIRVRVVERRIGISSYSFVIPADVWDAAVRGALPFPTDEELKKLKDEYEGQHWEMCDLREDSENYIKALEARVRELTAELMADQVDFEEGQPTHVDAPSDPSDIPVDLEAALSELLDMLNPDEVAEIKSIPEKDMARFHHGPGRDIRNMWNLWGDSPLRRYFISLGIEHADDMSGILLDSLWRRVNGQPIRLEEQVQFYKDYWKKMGDGSGQTVALVGYGDLDEGDR